jgi:hypothetical protein
MSNRNSKPHNKIRVSNIRETWNENVFKIEVMRWRRSLFSLCWWLNQVLGWLYGRKWYVERDDDDVDGPGWGRTNIHKDITLFWVFSLSHKQTIHTHTHIYIIVNIYGIVVYLMLCRAPDLFRIDIIMRTSWMLSHHSTDRWWNRGETRERERRNATLFPRL